MARTVKLAPTEKSTPNAKQVIAPSRLGTIRNNLPTILGAVALVAAFGAALLWACRVRKASVGWFMRWAFQCQQVAGQT